MNLIFDTLFSQYSDYSTAAILLEFTAIIFGFASVIYSKKNNILVFPTGIISTLIFVYLLYQWELLGDMIINAYYFIMSIYGWYIWTRKNDKNQQTSITYTTIKEHITSVFIFLGTSVFIIGIYTAFDKWNSWTAYVDTITTGLFFVGMWLMAKRKIENWIYWIIADLISVPLYFYKGYTLTSIQYLIFTLIAVAGYMAWKKKLNNKTATV